MDISVKGLTVNSVETDFLQDNAVTDAKVVGLGRFYILQAGSGNFTAVKTGNHLVILMGAGSGGSGGAGSSTSGGAEGGHGGQAGAIKFVILALTAGNAYAYSVGSGGAYGAGGTSGGAGHAGSAGGDTTFDSQTAGGGQGSYGGEIQIGEPVHGLPGDTGFGWGGGLGGAGATSSSLSVAGQDGQGVGSGGGGGGGGFGTSTYTNGRQGGNGHNGGILIFW